MSALRRGKDHLQQVTKMLSANEPFLVGTE